MKHELLVRPGHHVFEVTAQGRETQRWETIVSTPVFHELDLKPIAPRVIFREATPRAPAAPAPVVAPWVITLTGASVVVAGAITGAISLGLTDDLERRCPLGACPAGVTTKDARLYSNVADGLLLGGSITAAIGAAWLIVAYATHRPMESLAGQDLRFSF